jgi:large subunit ribosomal protein L25
VTNTDQAPGVKRGGTVNIVTHTIDVQCKPEAIPEAIDVDVAALEINYSKHLSDISFPEGVKPVARVDLTLVTIVPPSGYAEEMRAAAEAAAAAAAAAAVAAEAGAVPGAEGAAAAPGATPGAAPAAAPAAGAPAAGAAAAPKK